MLEGDLTVQQVLDWFVVSSHCAQGQVTLALAPVLASNRPTFSTPSAAALDGVSQRASTPAGCSKGAGHVLYVALLHSGGRQPWQAPALPAAIHPLSRTCHCLCSCGTLLRMCLR